MSPTTEPHRPSTPRPPQAEILAVLPDLARILSDSDSDNNGLRHLATDEAKSHLQARGHTGAAIDWAIFTGVKNTWLTVTTCKRDRRTSNPHTGKTQARPNTVDVPAIAALDAFWNTWESGSFAPRTKQLVFLIHGIRTHANWQPMVQRVLEELPDTRVVPLKYGFFDAIRFWCPLLTRQGPVDEVRREIQYAHSEYPDADLSVIAHSFGTYIISRILLETPDIRLKRLVLSGCIIPRRYRWDYVKTRIETVVINDYGTRDVWPVLAKSLSWGYGDTGRHGFGRGGAINDRGHNYSHSDFFNEDFVRKFWRPWFHTGEYVASEWDESAPPSPWLLSIVSILPLQWVILIGLILLLARNFGSTSSHLPTGMGKEALMDESRHNGTDPEKKRVELSKQDSQAVLAAERGETNQDGECIAILSGHTDGVCCAMFSKDSSLVLTGGYDGTARIWDIAKQKELYKFNHNFDYDIGVIREGSYVTRVQFISNDADIIAGIAGGNVYRWSLETGALKREFKSSMAQGGNVAVCEEAGILAMNYSDGTGSENQQYLQLFDLESGAERGVLAGGWASISDIDFSPKGDLVLAAPELVLWDIMRGTRVYNLKDVASCAAFSPSGDSFLSAGQQGPMKLTDTKTGEMLKAFRSQSYTWDVAISSDGRYALSGGTQILTDGTEEHSIWLWNLAAESVLDQIAWRFDGHTGRVNSVAFSADDLLVVSTSVDGTARVWRVPGKLLQ